MNACDEMCHIYQMYTLNDIAEERWCDFRLEHVVTLYFLSLPDFEPQCPCHYDSMTPQAMVPHVKMSHMAWQLKSSKCGHFERSDFRTPLYLMLPSVSHCVGCHLLGWGDGTHHFGGRTDFMFMGPYVFWWLEITVWYFIYLLKSSLCSHHFICLLRICIMVLFIKSYTKYFSKTRVSFINQNRVTGGCFFFANTPFK